MFLDKPRPNFPSTVENSLPWRVWHGINYMNGGITFFLGSYCYYPYPLANYSGDVVGAWLFTLGSLTFLLADLTEWNHYKIGCFNRRDYAEPHTVLRTFKRMEIGLNFFASMMGSLLYLLGSICFIPATNLLVEGELLFIVGSAFIFFSQLWKILRSLGNEEDLSLTCNFKEVWEDFAGFLVDLFAGLGGGCYFIGTYYFQYVITDADEIYATNWFMAGGTCFSLSGFAMMYRYFGNKKSDMVKSERAHIELAEEKEGREYS